MKKRLLLLFAILGLLIGAAMAVPFLFKDRIMQAAKDAANQELNAIFNFESIDVSLLQNIQNFPDITLVLHQPSIAGVGQFSGDTLVKMDKLKLAIDIQSLFQTDKPMKINRIELVDADILAKVAADGQANWQITVDTAAEKEPSKFDLAIEEIVLENVDIVYKDIPGNTSAECLGLNHKAQGDFTNNLVHYSSTTSIEDLSYFQGLIPYIKNARFSNSSVIDIDQVANKYTFSENAITLNDLKLIFNGYFQQLDADALGLNIDFKSENNEFKKVLSLIPALYKNDFKNIQTKGNFDLQGKIEGIYHGSTYPKMDIALMIQNGEFQYPQLPKKVSNIEVVSSMKSPGGSLDNLVVDVSKFSMNIGNDPFTGKLKLTQLLSNPYVELYTKGKINLNDVLKFYPMPDVKRLEGGLNLDLDLKARKSDVESKNYSSVKAEGLASIQGLHYASARGGKPVHIGNMTLKFSPQYVDMPSCQGNMGATDFNVKARLENFLAYYLSNDATMKGTIDFQSRKVDVNELMEDEKETSKSDYFMVPNRIDFGGHADIKAMQYGKMNIQNIQGSMTIQNERINLNDVKADLLGGSAKMNAIYSTVGQTKPLTAVNYSIESFDIHQVYNYMECAPKLAPILKYMTGKLSSNSNLTMSLLPDMSPDLSTINGDLSVAIPIAKIVDVPMLQSIANATKLSQLNKLETTNLKADMSLDNGRVILKPMQFKAGNNLDMTIAGFQGLDKSLDYKVAIDLPFSQLGPASSVVSGLVSKFKLPFASNLNPETVRLNMNVKGFFDKPAISLGAPEVFTGGKATDPKGMAVEGIKNAGEELKNKAIQSADSMKQAAMQEANKKVEEAKQEAERRVDEAKKKAEDEVNKKKEDLMNELKKKLPW